MFHVTASERAPECRNCRLANLSSAMCVGSQRKREFFATIRSPRLQYRGFAEFLLSVTCGSIDSLLLLCWSLFFQSANLGEKREIENYVMAIYSIAAGDLLPHYRSHSSHFLTHTHSAPKKSPAQRGNYCFIDASSPHNYKFFKFIFISGQS